MLKLSKMSKKWLINVSEGPNMINATLDNGESLKHVCFFCVSCSFYFKLLEKVKKYVKFSKHQIKVCFMLVLVTRMVNLASVELSGELMREIHQI